MVSFLLLFLGKKPSVIPSEGDPPVELRFGQDYYFTHHWFRQVGIMVTFSSIIPAEDCGQTLLTLKSSLFFLVSSLCQLFSRKSSSFFPVWFSDHSEICKASHQAKQQAFPEHRGEQGTLRVAEGRDQGWVGPFWAWTLCCAQSYLILCDPLDYSLLGSSLHEILQARILAWVATPSSWGSSRPRDQTHVSYVCRTGRQILYHCIT